MPNEQGKKTQGSGSVHATTYKPTVTNGDIKLINTLQVKFPLGQPETRLHFARNHSKTRLP